MTKGDDPIETIIVDRSKIVTNYGLTKREYFAAMAMQGTIAHHGLNHVSIRSDRLFNLLEAIGKDSVGMADALIQALNEGSDKDD